MRTERPALPTLPSDLTKRERLQPLNAKSTGDLVSIDRDVLAEMTERLAQAIGAVERGNNRAAGVRQWWTCVDAVFRTGKAPAGCAAK